MICFHVRRGALEYFLDSKKKEITLWNRGFRLAGTSLMKVLDEWKTHKEAAEACRQGFETPTNIMRSDFERPGLAENSTKFTSLDLNMDE